MACNATPMHSYLILLLSLNYHHDKYGIRSFNLVPRLFPLVWLALTMRFRVVTDEIDVNMHLL